MLYTLLGDPTLSVIVNFLIIMSFKELNEFFEVSKFS